MALWGRGFRKGTASAHISVWERAVPQLLPWCQTLQFLPVCHWCLSNCCPDARAQREWVCVSPCVGSLRGTVWGSSSFFHRLNPHWFLQPEVVGTYLPGTGTLGWGAWCGAGTPCSLDSPSEFSRTTREWGTSLFCICAPPASLDGCGFFNSVVVRLPFNSIFAGSGWWLFHILVVILMWLCEEVSHVCLCHHHDWKSSVIGD